MANPKGLDTGLSTEEWMSLLARLKEQYTNEEIEKMLSDKAEVNDLIDHMDDTTSHITSEERTAWNGVVDKVAQIQPRVMAKISSAGWYRIAQTDMLHTFYALSLTLGRIFNSAASEAWVISVCGTNISTHFKLINSAVNTQLFSKLRIVRSTYDMPAYIDLYYAGTSEHTCYAMISDNLFRYEYASAGFKAVAFTAAEIPEGYTATEFDLVDINATT